MILIQQETLTILAISRILDLVLDSYSEHLYFSMSIALMSAVAKLLKGSALFVSCH